MNHWRTFVSVVAVGLCAFTAAAEARQWIIVVTDGWEATQGSLSAFDSAAKHWEMRDVPVAIGKRGAAWGRGLHPPQAGPQKQEGDGRSPAGMFAIGSAFGYASTTATRLAYHAMTEFDYCVDVDGSPYYNQIVDARNVGRDAVAKSTEPMRRDLHLRGDQRYALGFVIEHNPQAVRSGGSCIFAHLWQAPSQTTAGCTAMSQDIMTRLLAWLRADRQPTFVLLPRAEYERVRREWQLPDVVNE